MDNERHALDNMPKRQGQASPSEAACYAQEEDFFCPHNGCEDHDGKNEYGCGVKSGGSTAPYPVFCAKCKDKESA